MEFSEYTTSGRINVQALIITAYKNEEMLIQLLKKTHKYFQVYLHIDKKSSIDIERIRKQFPDIYSSNKP